MHILVTGGAGYVGSHVCLELLQAGHSVVVIDNLHNGKRSALDRVEELADAPIELIVADLRDQGALRRTFEGHSFDAVIHLAGLKAVGESTERPLDYYANNVGGTLSLLGEMDRHDVRCVVFSSSATVYGDPQQMPIREDAPLGATSPYGHSKLMVEQMLRDLCSADPRWSAVLLRYFNPVGAHPSGRIGEDPRGIPGNLLPFVCQVAAGRRSVLKVFGNDYPTLDGTGVRDYLHVVDLALGHVAALRARAKLPGVHAYNLGTGEGASVHDLRRAVEDACGVPIPYEIVERRPGDIARCWADPSRARIELGWEASRSLAAAAEDAWRWQQGNPDGYPD